MSDELRIKDITTLVEECIKNNKIDFLANIIYVLQKNYKELAELCTDGNYHEGWTHNKVLDYITYET